MISLDISSYDWLISGIVVPAAMYLYANRKGFKLASLDKRIEYKNLKSAVGALTENISLEEFLEIVGVVLEKKKKGSITAADAQEIGKMVADAVKSK